ncbi:MAG: hemolysin family protein [Chrysiogenia bacterium]
MGLLLIYLTVALVFSFFCSLLEASLLSTSPIFINTKIKEGKKYAKRLQQFKKNIDFPLAAILTLNTFAHTIGAAGVGSQAQIIWGEEFLTIVSIILTLVILIGSEIIPKTLGAIYWKKLGAFTVVSLKVMIYSPLYPFILMTQLITRMLKKGKPLNTISRSDFRAIADCVIEEGVINDEESQLLKNLMRFNQIKVKSIMTPRVVVFAAEENTAIEEFYSSNREIRFSRIPVYEKELGHTTGFVLKDEFMEMIIEGKGDKPLKEIKREIFTVVETMPIMRLFYKFIELKAHIAMVVDEYGTVSGIVTMEDVIETLIGLEIMDEMDDVEDMQVLARKAWEQRAKKQGFIK